MPKGSIIVTGTNGGLGSAIVARILKTPQLASDNVGIYTVRNASTARALKSVIQDAPPSHQHETLDLDLGSLASVKSAANKIKQRVVSGELPPIRALILNAAYQDHIDLTMTDDGFEPAWQINYLANLVFTLLLLESMDKERGRIIIVGSWSHDVEDVRNHSRNYQPYGDPKWGKNIFPGPEELAKALWNSPETDKSEFAGYRRYGASKLCAVMFMVELGYRLARDPQLSKIRTIGVDPGAMSSDLTRRANPSLRFVIKYIMPLVAPVSTLLDPNGFIRTTSQSAKAVVDAAFYRDIAEEQGKPLYLNGTDVMEPAKATAVEADRKRLWKYGVEVAGITEGDTILTEWK